MQIGLGNFNDPRVKALLEYHLRGMHASSPPGHVFALDWTGLQKPEISFYTGWMDEALVVIGALRDLSDGTGEIKSMRVAEGCAGKGYGEAMLLHIIAEARKRKYSRLSLETGIGPPFEAAHALYRKHGFVEGEEFGGYVHTEFNELFHLPL
jgi:putative acetyltransferase